MSPSRTRTVLVTGGAGLVGAATARALLTRGAHVVVLDDFSAGSKERLPETAEGLAVLEADVRDAELLRTLLADGPRIDAIVHLAARVGVRTVYDDPDGCAAENLAGVTALIEALRATPGARRPRVFAASSSEVYAERAEPLDEAAPLRAEADGRWAYAASKRAGEALLDTHAGLWPERAAPVHLRFFNVVGPGQNAASGMVLPRFVEAARDGGTLEVHGDGRQVRTFAHVADVADDLARLAFGDVDAPPGPLNLGGTARASIQALAEVVAAQAERTLGKRPIVRRVDPDRAVARGFQDVRHRVPILDRARALGLCRRSRPLVDIVSDALAHHVALAPATPSRRAGHTAPIRR